MSTVLIVDDDPVSRQFMKDVLSAGMGLAVLEARNVGEGIALAQDSAPDLILLDQHMPDGTAADFCDGLIGKAPALASVPKWVVTGERPLDWDEDLWHKRGVVGYMMKPCQIDQLENAVRKAMGKK